MIYSQESQSIRLYAYSMLCVFSRARDLNFGQTFFIYIHTGESVHLPRGSLLENRIFIVSKYQGYFFLHVNYMAFIVIKIPIFSLLHPESPPLNHNLSEI